MAHNQPTGSLGQVFCPNCGTVSEWANNACPNCGFQTGTGDAAPPLQPPVAAPLPMEHMGFGVRLLAAFIDYMSTWVFLVVVVVTLLSLAFPEIVEAERGGQGASLVLGALWFVFGFPIYSVLWISFGGGQTPGKKLLGIMVVNAQGGPPGFWRALAREVPGKFVSTLAFMVGFSVWGRFLVGDWDRDWGEEKWGLHDLIAGTYVVRKVAAPLPMEHMGFWVRLLAEFIDDIPFWVVFYLLLSLAFPGVDTEGVVGHVVWALWFFGFPIYRVLWISFGGGQTPGKKLLGIMVVNVQGGPPGFWRALAREVPGKFVSTLTLVGFLVVGWNEQKRGLHDLVAGTYVVRKRQRPV